MDCFSKLDQKLKIPHRLFLGRDGDGVPSVAPLKDRRVPRRLLYDGGFV